ncbi:MAG: glycosyltransferase [Burkholderiaceae bacterium]|nr:glycosyltransferase [Burkholderiaceae bacterium]
MKRLRVLHVLGEIKPSGAEVMLLAALPGFRAAGVEPALLATGAAKGDFAARFEAAGCEVLHLPLRRAPAFFWQVYRLLRDPRWDVIHLHTERANFYFGVVALATGKTVIRTVHNVFSFEGALRRRRGLQRRTLERFGLRHVAIGQSVLANEVGRFGIRPALVDNWFDDASFAPATPDERSEARSGLGVEPGRFVIASVGNCSDVKNHKSLLHALAELPPELRPMYLHAGIEEPGAPERELAAELGLHGDVRFLGAVRDVPGLLHAADAFVMPSLYEGFGVAAVEALGSGLSAIFADVPGLCDFKARFHDIVYCEPKAASIATALQRLLRLPAAERARIASTQAECARRHYGTERGVQQYVKLYRKS